MRRFTRPKFKMEDEEEEIQQLRRAVMSSIPDKSKDIRVIETIEQKKNSSKKHSQNSRSGKEREKQASSENFEHSDLRHKLKRRDGEENVRQVLERISNKKDASSLKRNSHRVSSEKNKRNSGTTENGAPILITVSNELHTENLSAPGSQEKNKEHCSEVDVIHKSNSDRSRRLLKVSSKLDSGDEEGSDSGKNSMVADESESGMDSDYTIEVDSRHASDHDDSDSVYSVEFKNIGGSEAELSNSEEEDVNESNSANDTRKTQANKESVEKITSKENRDLKNNDAHSEHNKRKISLKKVDILPTRNEVQEKGNSFADEKTKSSLGDVNDKDEAKTRANDSVVAKQNSKNILDSMEQSGKLRKSTEAAKQLEMKVRKSVEDSKKESENSKTVVKSSDRGTSKKLQDSKKDNKKDGEMKERLCNDKEEIDLNKGKREHAVTKKKEEINTDSPLGKKDEIKKVGLKKEAKNSQKENHDKSEKKASKDISGTMNKLDSELTNMNPEIKQKEKKTVSKKEAKSSRARSLSSDSSCSTCSSSSSSNSSDSESDSGSSKSSQSESESESSSATSSSSSTGSESESSSEDNFKRKKRRSESRGRGFVRRDKSKSPHNDKKSRYFSPLRTNRSEWGRHRATRDGRIDRSRERSRDRLPNRSEGRFARNSGQSSIRRSRNRSYDRSRRSRERSVDKNRKEHAPRQRYRSREGRRSNSRDPARSVRNANRDVRGQQRHERSGESSKFRSGQKSDEHQRERTRETSVEKLKYQQSLKRKASPVPKDTSKSSLGIRRSRSMSHSKEKTHQKAKAEISELKPNRHQQKHTRSKSPAQLSKEQENRDEKTSSYSKKHDKTLKMQEGSNKLAEKNSTKTAAEDLSTKQNDLGENESRMDRRKSELANKDEEKKEEARRDNKDRRYERPRSSNEKSKDLSNKPRPLMEITLTGLKRPSTGYDRLSRRVSVKNVSKTENISSRIDKRSFNVRNNETESKKALRDIKRTSPKLDSINEKTHTRRLSSGKTVLLERRHLQPLMQPVENDYVAANQMTRVVERKEEDPDSNTVTRRVVTESRPTLKRRSVEVTTNNSAEPQPQPKRKVFSRLGKQVVGKSKNIAINLKKPASKIVEKPQNDVNKDEEDHLDSRIKQIREKNEAILRRQREIEEDIKIYS